MPLYWTRLFAGLARLALLFGAIAALVFAQRMEGDLQVKVTDESGDPLEAKVELTSWTSMFHTEGQTQPDTGEVRLRRLPFGAFRLRVTADGFSSYETNVQLSSAVPVNQDVRLSVSPVETTLVVVDRPPLIDAGQVAPVYQMGRSQLEELPASTPGRGVIEAIQSMPGWLLEANAVLHPRGSEYDTQYVIDGMPVLDNRSINYVPGFDSEDYEGVQVMTAGIPAEYGRRLGGVIELHTRRPANLGHHPEGGYQGGSFSTSEGFLTDLYQRGSTAFTGGVRAAYTDRYLDPPSLENYTNKGSSVSGFARFEQDLSPADRINFSIRGSRVGFLVPNTSDQEEAGQRQDRRGQDLTGQMHYQRVLAPGALLAVRGMARDVDASLWSNPFATPVYTGQDRGFREGVVNATLTLERRRHTLTFGGDFRHGSIQEFFLFRPESLPAAESFEFQDRRAQTDASAFVDEQYRAGNWTIRAGLRVDYYRLLIRQAAVSPRIGAAYFWAPTGITFHASYDRAFQTPPVENLLLSSSSAAQGLPSAAGYLPVRPSFGNFFEVGFRRAFARLFRLEVNQYWRRFRNFSDDDVFLNTGISLPINFARARVRGTEARLEMPSWRGVSWFASYSYMRGQAEGPVTGGLFLEGSEAEELRDSSARFPITQDQRNTASLVARYQVSPALWVGSALRYGSGLPVELAGDQEDDDTPGDDIPQAILNRVDFARGRVKPNLRVDLSAGWRIWQQETRSLRLQGDIVNLANRLNLINFSGVFSGTAIASPRAAYIRMRFTF